MPALELDDLRLHRRGHLRSRTAPLGQGRLQARFPLRAVDPHPQEHRARAHAQFAGDLLNGEAFLEAELHRFAPDLKRVGVRVRTRGLPPRLPRGTGPPLLPWTLAAAFHGSHSFRGLLGTPAAECHPFSSPVFAHDLVVSSTNPFASTVSSPMQNATGSSSCQGGAEVKPHRVIRMFILKRASDRVSSSAGQSLERALASDLV